MTKIEIITENANTPLVTRLRAQMLRKGLNPKTLAERANVGRSFVYDILSGRSCNPTSGKIAAIAQELGVSMQYLLSGVHSQAGSAENNWTDIATISTLKIESTMNSNIIVSVADVSSSYYFTESWIRETLHSTPEYIRNIAISCDSMYPTLKAGDSIMVDIAKKDINPPGIFVIFDGVALKPRRLEMLAPERILVRADNDKYSSYETALADLHIVGKVVWLGRSF
jgi:transcriptional regulator with XRE-family HTH domain